jgi:hypothetical protein
MIDNIDNSSSITSSSSDEGDSILSSSEDHSTIATMYVYTGEGGGEVPKDVVQVSHLTPRSC